MINSLLAGLDVHLGLLLFFFSSSRLFLLLLSLGLFLFFLFLESLLFLLLFLSGPNLKDNPLCLSKSILKGLLSSGMIELIAEINAELIDQILKLLNVTFHLSQNSMQNVSLLLLCMSNNLGVSLGKLTHLWGVLSKELLGGLELNSSREDLIGLASESTESVLIVIPSSTDSLVVEPVLYLIDVLKNELLFLKFEETLVICLVKKLSDFIGKRLKVVLGL